MTSAIFHGPTRRVLELSRSLPAAWKRHLRLGLDHAARWSGALAHRERTLARDLLVLTYHRVLPAARCERYPFPSLAMPLDVFRQQMRWLAARGEVLPLGAALARNDAGARRPLFALTFDDGYEDAGEYIAEVLEDEGVCGTFFVTTGFVGTNELLWFDRAALLFSALAEPVRRSLVREVLGGRRADEPAAGNSDSASWPRYLKGLRPAQRAAILAAAERETGGPPSADGFRSLSVARLVELHRRGHEIGSHTVSHAMLPELDDATLLREVQDARDAVARWTGHDVPGFCFPNGDHDARSLAAVARAGHAYACTTRAGTHPSGSDPFRIRRVDVAAQRVTNAARRHDLTAFRRELCGLYRARAERAR